MSRIVNGNRVLDRAIENEKKRRATSAIEKKKKKKKRSYLVDTSIYYCNFDKFVTRYMCKNLTPIIACPNYLQIVPVIDFYL